jgi:thiamine-monophosphate kinase
MPEERVRDISEFELIDRLRMALPPTVRGNALVPIGIGDDAAAWTAHAGERVLVTTDSLVEGVHFRLDWTSWRDLGWKALAVNLSDIAAMAGLPVLATVSLALTGNETVSDLVELYRGMGELAQLHNVVIAGGDIVRTPHDFSIHVTALGHTLGGGKLLTRAGARPGDWLFVTGTLGASAAGLALLMLPADDPRRRATTAPRLIEAHLRPIPRIETGWLLAARNASSAMDLSDGLFGDLEKILDRSGVAAIIDLDKIPIAAAVRALFPDQAMEFATRGGEDYELLATIPKEGIREALELFEEDDVTVTRIGEIIERPATGPHLFVRNPDGSLEAVAPGAFDHFKAE